MEKIAQRRGLLNKLKEMTNVSGKAAEKFFNPEFLEVMNSVRRTDNDLRSIALGKSIDRGDIGSENIGLKDLLKEIKKNLNRREYMLAIAELGRFHKKMVEIYHVIKKFKIDVDKVHHDFLFKSIPEDKLTNIKNIKQQFDNRAYLEFDIVKEAGLMDFFHNISSTRGRALAAWEKRYPKVVGKLKDESLSMLNRSQILNDFLNETFKVLGDARAERNVDTYNDALNSFIKEFIKYDSTFKAYYDSQVEPWMKRLDQTNIQQPMTNQLNNQINNQTIKIPELNLPATNNLQQPETIANPTMIAPTVQAPPPQFSVPIPADTERTLPEDAEDPQEDKIPETKRSASHREFYNTLEKLSNEDPKILVKFIKKYAVKIQETDLNTSIKLFNLIKSIGE